MAESQTQTLEPSRRAGPVDALKRAIREHLTYTLARSPSHATERDVYMAAAWSVRDRLAERWAATQQRYRQGDTKRVYYLSLEFLMGRTLVNALLNLGLDGAAVEAAEDLGYRLEELREAEPDAGLGNGGLGRLAACYMDSMATQQIPGYGYGIRYEHGIFRQRIVDGWQVEMPDNWLQLQNPWEIARPDRTYRVQFNGHVEAEIDAAGRTHLRWVDTQDVLAMAYDTPVPGYRNHTVNTLRLWAAKATEEFQLEDFFRGDYIAAVDSKIRTESISKVLYPPDDTGSGKELRLRQQYFFVSATLQDILVRYLHERRTFDDLPEKVQIQLNDTHPAVAIPELMRLLMDEHGLEWDTAWRLARRTFAYTNHTVLPEALESWSEEMFGRLLPRHLQIIHEIDRRLRDRVRESFPGEEDRVERMAIVSNGVVRMASLAIAGSHTVNGVAELHTQILRERIFRDFHQLWPKKLVSITNGVTPRRWMLKANPEMSTLITDRIGDGWIRDLEELHGLEAYAEDPELHRAWQRMRGRKKTELARLIERETGFGVSTASLFDVHIKRLHEYKRQHMNALRLIDTFLRIRDEPELEMVPRTVLFAGKAAPTYHTAKLIIRLIHAVGDCIRAHPTAAEKLSVVFLPNYSVTQAERIIPATDLSEQISTAGYEASGTGNMKFALNGALTIGTMDGANVEIAERVGREEMFIFGLSAPEVLRRKEEGYEPRAEYESSERLRRVLDFLISPDLSPDDPERFRPLRDSLLAEDGYMVLADFEAYLAAQEEVDRRYLDPTWWTTASIRNVARCGYFSSDRSVAEYAEKVWKLEPGNGNGGR